MKCSFKRVFRAFWQSFQGSLTSSCWTMILLYIIYLHILWTKIFLKHEQTQNSHIVHQTNSQVQKMQNYLTNLPSGFGDLTYLSKSKSIFQSCQQNKRTNPYANFFTLLTISSQQIIISMTEQLVVELQNITCNLTRKEIGEEEIQWLCSQEVSHIQTLRLSYNSIGPAPMIHFQHTQWLSLRKLYLTETLIGDKGCKSLSRADLDGLKELFISRNLITSTGAMHLSKGKWKLLECIDLSFNKMSNRCVKTLMGGNWKELQIIWMANMNLGFGQIMHYFASQYAKLECIFIDDDGLNEEKVDLINSSMNLKYPQITDCFNLQLG